MAWPKGRKLSASHKAAISRSLKGRGKQTARRTGRAVRGAGRASGAIVKRTLRSKRVQRTLVYGAAGVALNVGIAAAGRRARLGSKPLSPTDPSRSVLDKRVASILARQGMRTSQGLTTRRGTFVAGKGGTVRFGHTG